MDSLVEQAVLAAESAIKTHAPRCRCVLQHLPALPQQQNELRFTARQRVSNDFRTAANRRTAQTAL